MTDGKIVLTELASWKQLKNNFEKIKGVHLRELFASDSNRGGRMAIEAEGVYFDYSKHRINDETLQLFIQLATESGLKEKIEAMFRGDKINSTEKRSVLHIALRTPKDKTIIVDGVNIVPQIHAVIDKMAGFADKIRKGEWKGYTGKVIKNIVNIGIGGSDLGPVMAYEALKAYTQRGLVFRFVSNEIGRAHV